VLQNGKNKKKNMLKIVPVKVHKIILKRNTRKNEQLIPFKK
jgi:hypothetical protein